MLSRLLTLVTATALASCGGGATQAPPPDTGGEDVGGGDTAEAVPEVSAPPQAWEQMSFDAKQSYMMEKVLPVMEAKFQAHDAQEFDDFGCASCHGEDARDREFAMPSPDLPALYPSGHPKQEQMVEEQKEMATFMFQEVVPSMQTMLGAEPYDEATGEGFSCFSCHPKAEVEGGEPATETETETETEAGTETGTEAETGTGTETEAETEAP